MKKMMNLIAAVAAVICLSVLQAAAGPDHKDFVSGPFTDGQSVTKKCLECHEKQATDFMKTAHWTWKGKPNHVKGMEKSTKEYGKFNMINNFCVAVFQGKDSKPMESCGKCHAGYGWNSTKFDHKDKSRVDCLVCHATKGNYERAATGCDVNMTAMQRGSMDLNVAAQSVGKPRLENCGYCHFNGGGGDATKVPGLDSTLLKASKSQDVHMAKTDKGGLGFSCQDCHKTKDHKISGASSMMAHFDSRTSCTDCHKAPHKNLPSGAILAKHAASVACETCHIPALSRGQATKVGWYWSDVGKNIEEGEQFDRDTFQKRKGTFKYAKNFQPAYAWYNGKIERYMVGDKIKDPSKPVVMIKPAGSIKDRKAKIYPYKFYEGTQPMDSKFMYLSTFQQYKSLWDHYDWEKALQDGSQGLGLPYSGKYQFVKTEAWLMASHEVAPKENAVKCFECHMGGKRMDWKALGYKEDPMVAGGRFPKKR